MPRWDIAETRRLIELRHGSEQIRRARHCLRSVTERLRHARYHFQEARNLLKSHIDDRLDTKNIYTLTWPTAPEEWSTLDNCMMKVEANLIACAQGIHSIADTLAHIVYFALGLDRSLGPLKERDVNISKVISVLKQTPAYSEVERAIASLLEDSSFALVTIMTNHAKHRGFPESRLSIDPPDQEAPYAMEFGAFAYNKIEHSEHEIEKVIAPAYKAADRAVIDTGNALNLVLSRKCAPHLFH